MKTQASAVMLATLSIAQLCWAHGGGLDAQGCHRNRKTGDYHCHGARAAAPASASTAGKANFLLHPAQTAAASETESGPRFHSCAHARAAGYSAMRVGEPGYAAHLDRDRDGIDCER